MPPQSDDGSLEKAKKRLYDPAAAFGDPHAPLSAPDPRELPHGWQDDPLPQALHQGKRHVRLATVFLIAAFAFFLLSLAVASYFLYYSSNSISADKITIDVQGPTSIAGGDTVPLSLTITNRNSVAIKDATIEIDFPSGTRDASNPSQANARYTENLGTIPSGGVITRSVKAIIFGGAGQSLSLPISLSYGTPSSNAVFVKKSEYTLTISSTPLSISVETLAETVSGQPITLMLVVRSNATTPLTNVVLAGSFPFGFSVTSSSLPLTGSNFLIGTVAPGATKTITLLGKLTGQDNEQKSFHFTVGTANSPSNQTLAVTYMTQDISVTLAAPFIDTTLSLNNDTSSSGVITAGQTQTITASYRNTLATSVTNTTISIALAGSAIDYNSIRAPSGFYNSADRTIVFNRDTDPSLATLAPGVSGTDVFTFSTLPAATLGASPSITFTTSVSGTRVGESNVPEQVSATATKTVKVVTNVGLSARTLHSSGSLANGGPIPPRANQATTYAIVWGVSGGGSAIAGGSVTATLPTYVTYTGKTSGQGSFSYNSTSRTVTWSTGDLAQGASAQGAFQVSLTPSSSQKGSAPTLTSATSFSGYDRFAGVQVSATASAPTTETPGDPGYVSTNATVQ